jgi:cobalt-zinc-cadmium efflux system outer membrane protein
MSGSRHRSDGRRAGALAGAALLTGSLAAVSPAFAQQDEPPTHGQHGGTQAEPAPPAESGAHEHAMEPAGEAAAEPMPELAGDPLALAELERRTIEHNPEILQALAAIRAAEGLRRQVGLYPNPTLGVAAEEIPLESGRDGGKVGGFLTQPIVTGGKLRLNRRIFEQEVERAAAVAELARLRELNRVRMLHAETVAAQRMVELRDRLARLAREAVEITAQLYNTGAADRPDQLAIEIDAELAELALADARRRLEQLWRQLRAAVGDPALEPRRLEDRLEEAIPVLGREETLQAVLDGSPEVRFARAGVIRAELALRRERVEPIPDLELTAGVLDNREPVFPGGPAIGNELFGELGVRIPLFNRNQGNIAAAEAEVERAEEELRKTRLKLEARFAPVFADYLDRHDTVRRYRESILGRAEEAYDLYRARYGQMAAAYPQVLISQRTLFEAEAAYVEALARLWQSVVLLEGMLLEDEPTPQMLEDSVLRRTPIEIAQ